MVLRFSASSGVRLLGAEPRLTKPAASVAQEQWQAGLFRFDGETSEPDPIGAASQGDVPPLLMRASSFLVDMDRQVESLPPAPADKYAVRPPSPTSVARPLPDRVAGAVLSRRRPAWSQPEDLELLEVPCLPAGSLQDAEASRRRHERTL